MLAAIREMQSLRPVILLSSPAPRPEQQTGCARIADVLKYEHLMNVSPPDIPPRVKVDRPDRRKPSGDGSDLAGVQTDLARLWRIMVAVRQSAPHNQGSPHLQIRTSEPDRLIMNPFRRIWGKNT
jgi:hypothetical protein